MYTFAHCILYLHTYVFINYNCTYLSATYSRHVNNIQYTPSTTYCTHPQQHTVHILNNTLYTSSTTYCTHPQQHTVHILNNIQYTPTTTYCTHPQQHTVHTLNNILYTTVTGTTSTPCPQCHSHSVIVTTHRTYMQMVLNGPHSDNCTTHSDAATPRTTEAMHVSTGRLRDRGVESERHWRWGDVTHL